MQIDKVSSNKYFPSCLSPDHIIAFWQSTPGAGEVTVDGNFYKFSSSSSKLYILSEKQFDLLFRYNKIVYGWFKCSDIAITSGSFAFFDFYFTPFQNNVYSYFSFGCTYVSSTKFKFFVTCRKYYSDSFTTYYSQEFDWSFLETEFFLKMYVGLTDYRLKIRLYQTDIYDLSFSGLTDGQFIQFIPYLDGTSPNVYPRSLDRFSIRFGASKSASEGSVKIHFANFSVCDYFNFSTPASSSTFIYDNAGLSSGFLGDTGLFKSNSDGSIDYTKFFPYQSGQNTLYVSDDLKHLCNLLSTYMMM